MEALPAEVMTYVASYLSRKELTVAVRVCRSWNTMLTPEIYKTIDGSVHFVELMRNLRQSGRQKQLGHFVRNLSIPESIEDVDDCALALLPVLCPFVTQLKIVIEDESHALSFLREWKYLSQISIVFYLDIPPMLSADFPRYALTELTIYGDDYEQWVEFLAELPCIEKLRIQSHDYAEYEANEDDCKISCNSLEKIHNCLPRLRYLCIDPYISFGNMPESIVPCDTVRELALTLVRGRPWGEYLAQKYTHLEKLYIGDLLSHDEDSLEQLCAFATGCTHLREFDSDEIRTYRPFLDALSNVGAPIRELRFDLWDQQWVVDKLDKFKQTCTSVRLRLQKETLGWPVFGAFAPYLSLTHLTVDIHYGEMELDKILSQIEQIRHLSVTAQDFCVGRDRKRDLRHNLDTLYLQGCINDQVYVYLSECCPRLSRLQCTYADAYRESCVIYCPNTSLKKLSITLSGDYVFKLAKIEDRNGSKNNNNESPRVSQNAKSSTRWLLHGTYYNSFESLEASGLSKMSWRKAQATENKRIFPMNIASIHYRHIASMELKSATASRFNKVQ